MKTAWLAAFALAASFARAGTAPTPVADVVSMTYYDCIKPDGTSRPSQTNTPQASETCALSGPWLITNPSRPGLAGYATMMSDGNVAILMNFERFTAVGDVREAWIMLSYAKPQPALYGTYTRSVAKWSANCRASLVSSGVGTLYTLNGQNVEAAGTIPATLAEEPTPNTVGEVVMNTICKFTPPNR